MSVDFRESVVFDDTHFDVSSRIREAYEFDHNKNDKQSDFLVIHTGHSRTQITLTPADAKAIIVMLSRYLEASSQNTLALEEQYKNVAA